jgi:hypothetical protein
MDEYLIEVFNSTKNIWSKAILLDLDVNLVTVRLENSQLITHYSNNDTRLVSRVELPLTLKPGDDCEILNEGLNSDEPSSWWPAIVKMIKGEFFVVDYKNPDDKKTTDIVSSDKIRPPNKSPMVTLDHFYKITFDVPVDLHEMYVHFLFNKL